jgi:signal transduction histidine kinase
MAADNPPTQFAPAERALAQEIDRQARLFAGTDLLGILPDAVPCAVFVVNRHRQIVFANERFLELVPPERRGNILGQRPGEVIGCIHASESLGGCGTTESCSVCGAVHAVLSSQQGRTDVQECRLTRGTDNEALDVRVWTTPIDMDGEHFSIVAAIDISHEKRREALERLFLHDISNVAYGLKWYTEFLRKGTPDNVEKFCDSIYRLSSELIDEIDSQRILLKAESGELTFTPTPVGTLGLIHDAVELYNRHPVSVDRHLRIDATARDTEIVSDRTLLSRVLCNMIKNALEASHAGETVTVGCALPEDKVEFWVHNPGVMPREVQLQVFQRSFSTKGRGRGLGTHSIRLLTERYLKGSVSFTSTAEHGTTFRVRCPLDRQTR